jgi:hypothetical protein
VLRRARLLRPGVVALVWALAPSLHVTTSVDNSQDSIQVKFRDGTAVRLRNDQLVSRGGADLSDLQAVLSRYPGLRIERLFTRPEEDLEQERVRAEAATGRQQPDLNLYYRLLLPAGADAEALLSDLNALPIVEVAYAEPLPQPPPGNPGLSPPAGGPTSPAE